MSKLDPAFREIISLATTAFKPYDRNGVVALGLTWLPLSPESKNGGPGCFAVRFAPGARSERHQHREVEEFCVLEGELIDEDGERLRVGDFIRYEPGTEHSSLAPDGALILVFLRAPNDYPANDEAG